MPFLPLLPELDQLLMPFQTMDRRPVAHYMRTLPRRYGQKKAPNMNNYVKKDCLSGPLRPFYTVHH
jgi:hypothetical protein